MDQSVLGGLIQTGRTIPFYFSLPLQDLEPFGDFGHWGGIQRFQTLGFLALKAVKMEMLVPMFAGFAML